MPFVLPLPLNPTVIILSEPVFGDYYIPIKDELCGEDIEISLKKKS